MIKKIIVLMILSATAIQAQFKEGQSIDKIVAIVGKQIVMKSDIDGRIMMMKQQNPSVDINDPEIREEILNSVIDEKLILTKALEDSIDVSNDEIESRWDVFLQTEISRYGSEDRIEKIYGKSIPRIKSELREEIRNQLVSYKITQQKFGNIDVSKREVEEFFEEYKDSLSNIPASYELYHIVKEVAAETDKKEVIYRKAVEIRDSIVKYGGEFEDFAERYSDDTYTATEGGDLGWFNKSKLFEEYVDAATLLSKGEVSQPVETPLGFHVIKLIDKDQERINTKHILFKIGQSEKDRERAKELLLQIKKDFEAGKSFEELAKQFSDEKSTRGFGGYLGRLSADELPSDIASIIKDLPEGEVTDPILYKNDPVSPSYRIIYKKEFVPEHAPDLESDYEQIKQRATMYKRINEIRSWVKTLREELYWEIK